MLNEKNKQAKNPKHITHYLRVLKTTHSQASDVKLFPKSKTLFLFSSFPIFPVILSTAVLHAVMSIYFQEN